MLERLKQMLIKELLQMFRDKRTRIVLFVPPLVQMLVFGYAATYEIRHIPTAILDYDNSQESRDLISRLAATPYFSVQHKPETPQQLIQEIDRGEVVLALRLNAGFARKLEDGQPAPIQVIVDATNSNTALIALGYVSSIAQRFSSDYQLRRIQLLSPASATGHIQVELESRPWYNANLESRWFFVPGVIGSLTMLIVIILTAFAVVREREIGTLEQIMVTPISSAEFILGKTVPFFLIGLLDAGLIGALGTFWFQVPFRGSIWVLLLGTVLFLLCMLGVGLLISTVSATQQQAMMIAFFFIMPAIVFSGFGFPISTMPHWLQIATYLSPLRYYLVVLRGVYLKGVGFSALKPQMLGMLLLGSLLLAFSILRFHKTVD